MGGSDNPSNLIRLTIEEHAEAHRKLFETYNKPEDKLAWLALSGLLNMTEISREAQRIGSSRGGKIGGPIAGEKSKRENLGFLAKDTEWHRQKGLLCVKQQIGIHKPGFDKSPGGKIGGNNCRDEGLGFHAPGFDHSAAGQKSCDMQKGIHDPLFDHSAVRKKAGNRCRDEGLGFHAPGFDHGSGSRNTIWIHKDGIEKKCKDHVLASFIEQGWTAGRKPGFRRK
jgi:hypothetical protein